MTPDPAGDIVVRIDKPVGPTSHDVVLRARRVLGTRRIGHAGTLDPFASGLLLLCVNRATRLAEFLTRMDKAYLGVARLDGYTTTDDRTGAFLPSQRDCRELGTEEIVAAMARLTGTIEQVAPAFSAKKQGGQRDYQRARRGEVVPPRITRVTVHQFDLLELDLPELRFVVACSSGTYVRALARDLGRLLGTGGYLTELRRTRIGAWTVEQAVPLAQLESRAELDRAALTPRQALAHLPRLEVDQDVARKLGHGQQVPWQGAVHEMLVITVHDELVALARSNGESLVPVKVWRSERDE